MLPIKFEEDPRHVLFPGEFPSIKWKTVWGFALPSSTNTICSESSTGTEDISCWSGSPALSLPVAQSSLADGTERVAEKDGKAQHLRLVGNNTFRSALSQVLVADLRSNA